MVMSGLNINSSLTNAPPSDSPQVETTNMANNQGQTEEVLRLYERAMAAASNGIVIVDANHPNLPVIYCNSSFERITGYSRSEAIGHNCRFLQGKDTDPTAVERIRQAVRSGNECCVTLKNYRKDGTPFWNELVISPVLDTNGKLTHFIGIQNDITQRKEAEESLQRANEELEKRVKERTAALQQANEKLKVEIAERQWAETALRESEARFRAIFEKSAIGIAMADMKGKVIVSNQAIQEMLGYSEEELLSMVFTEFTHAEDAAAEIELYQQLIEGEIDRYQIEKRYCRKDGQLVWGNAIVSLIRDRNENPQFAIGIVTDITDRKLAEDALSATTLRLFTLIQNLQSGVLVENELRQIVLVNYDFCQKFGIPAPPEALIGMDCSQSAEQSKYLFAEPEQFVRRVEEILARKKIVTNEEILLADGRTFERDYVPIFVQEIYYGHLWMYRDITQRKQAEIALSLTRERLQFLLSSSPGVIYTCKADGDYAATFISENVKLLLGYEAREIIGDANFWPNHIHPEDAPHIFAELPRLFQQGFHIHEYRFLHKNGTYKWIYDQVKLVRDAEGKPLEVIGYWVDISARKLAEAERSRLAAILEASTDFVGLVDTQGNILWNNNQFQKIIGIHNNAELKHFQIADYHPAWALEIVRNEGIPTAIRDGVWVGETALLGNDGTEIPVSQMILSHKNERGVIEYLSTLIRDITPLKQAETALQQAKDRLQAAIDAVPGFVSWIGNDLRYKGVNQHLASKFNLSPENFIDREVGFLENSQDFAKFVRNFLASKDLASSQVVNVKINGAIRNYLMAAQKYQQGSAAITVGIDITDRNQAETELRASLKEKEVLLKEIHHRVKNNLQVISSLLKLQSGYIDNPSTLALFTDSQNRVKAMALIHEKLYQSSDLSRIQVSDYIQKLTNNLFQSYSVNASAVKLIVDIDDVFLDVDTAIPCGLIINELISNSLKYAFSGREQGEISLEFHLIEPQKYRLKISDNGVGLPPDFSLEETESLGLQLVWNLTEQLGGNIKLYSNNGTCFEITFARAIH